MWMGAGRRQRTFLSVLSTSPSKTSLACLIICFTFLIADTSQPQPAACQEKAGLAMLWMESQPSCTREESVPRPSLRSLPGGL